MPRDILLGRLAKSILAERTLLGTRKIAAPVICRRSTGDLLWPGRATRRSDFLDADVGSLATTKDNYRGANL